MEWKDLAGKVGAVAPLLGTLLGGPAGVAVKVGGLIAAALGTEPEPSAIEAALAADPLASQKLLELQAQRNLRFDELVAEQARLELTTAAADRASARDREVKTGDKATPRFLAAIIVGGFLFTVWYVLSGKVEGLKDPVAAGLIGTLIGYVSAKADQVVSYYFGSSAGSNAKNELLARRPR